MLLSRVMDKMIAERFNYVASGRLALWDTFEENKHVFIARLNAILKNHAGASLEVEGQELFPSEEKGVVALASVLDKIVSRGNPTLVDLDLEQHLLKSCILLTTADLADKTNGRLVGRSFVSASVGGANLLQAASDLFDRPHTKLLAQNQVGQLSNLASIETSVSEAEDCFYESFGRVYSCALQARVQRQVLISDLLGEEHRDLVGSRVDFALQLGAAKWVFEVDGSQHADVGQSAYDASRDRVLHASGWQVFRLSAETARSAAEAWLRQAWEPSLSHATREQIAAFGTTEDVDQDPAYELGLTVVLKPHVVHRCLRGLVQLISLGVLPTENGGKPVRILAIEEDVPAIAEAMRQLCRLWHSLHVISSKAPAPPPFIVHLVGSHSPFISESPNLQIQYVEIPEQSYDLIISHSFTLFTGQRGVFQEKIPAGVGGRRVEMRSAFTHRDDRRLPWSPRLSYDLADLEEALRSLNSDNPLLVPREKYDALRFFLQTVFRKNDFWDGQARVIARLLRGESAVVLLPTGGGKSLTYQFSGLLLPGVTVIVDPLVALMTDQVENLRNLAIDQVGFVSSQLDEYERDQAMEDIERARLYFAFISPERLQMPDFRSRLQALVAQVPISLAVIDEAHCVSEWGHDFRPSYLHMGRNIQYYCTANGSEPPTLVGLTGTASFAVLTDVQLELGVKEEEAIILPQSFDRTELTFHVEHVEACHREASLRVLKEKLPRVFQKNPQTFFRIRGINTNGGIVFCPYVNGKLGVVDVAAMLGHDNYYAGSKPKVWKNRSDKEWQGHKIRVQQSFKYDRVQELVATKSFGMGIDKPNIRYTIHYGIPQSVEAFYQEAGRAGRDGSERSSHCFILYSDTNWESALAILGEEDHQKAASMLDRVNRNDRGDLLVQLWFLFNTYQDRDGEKEYVLRFYEENLASAVEGMAAGAINSVEVSFAREQDIEQKSKEKAIFRLMALGVVEDYAINWRGRHFLVRVRSATPQDIADALERYFRQYKFEEFARGMTSDLPRSSVDEALQVALSRMVDFVYDEIVTKRKQALRTMAELCRTFASDGQFRGAILAYLQDSEFTPILKTWINRPFGQVGLADVYDLLNQVTTLDEAKRLVGTTRRMLDTDPGNVAIRYLSVCARLRSEAEGDLSVRQECVALFRQVEKYVHPDQHPQMILQLLQEVEESRAWMGNGILSDALRITGNGRLVRAFLEERRRWPDVPETYSAMIKLLAADALRKVQAVNFYDELLPDEVTNTVQA